MQHVLGKTESVYLNDNCTHKDCQHCVCFGCVCTGAVSTSAIPFSLATIEYLSYIDMEEHRIGTNEKQAPMLPELTRQTHLLCPF